MNNSEVDQSEIPEAVASVTYSIKSPLGFPALFTVRKSSGQTLIEAMTVIEKILVEKGYKPQEKMFGGVKKEIVYVENQFCPTCGGRLIEGQAKNGKKYWKCEHQKYDFQTKSVSGCTYIEWKQ